VTFKVGFDITARRDRLGGSERSSDRHGDTPVTAFAYVFVDLRPAAQRDIGRTAPGRPFLRMAVSRCCRKGEARIGAMGSRRRTRGTGAQGSFISTLPEARIGAGCVRLEKV
jgi:hypothetical protein